MLHWYLPVHDESRLEPEAYEFAVSLLLPPGEFNRLVPSNLTLGKARDLKHAFCVPIQASIRTAYTRGLIRKTPYTSLYEQISTRGWRHSEPDPLPVEAPSTWPDALDVHRLDHGYAPADLAAAGRVYTDDLAGLFPHNPQLQRAAPADCQRAP